MKINFILTLASLSMLALSCDFVSGTVYLNDSVYLCNFSSECPPNNVCVGFHIQWDATGARPKTNSVYSGYYGSCISESKTNNKMFACDNGTTDPSDDRCEESQCFEYATPVCPESLKNSCGNGVKDYNEECEYDYHHGRMYEDEFTFGPGIDCSNFFYNLNDQSDPETNYKLFTFPNNGDGNLYCNPNCKINTAHCNSVSELRDENVEEFNKHLQHSSFACQDLQPICSGPHAGICRDFEVLFTSSISAIIPIYNDVLGEDIVTKICINPETPYCENPSIVDDDWQQLSSECTDTRPIIPPNCNNGELNIEEEQCDGDEFDYGSNSGGVGAVCEDYGYMPGGDVTCNQDCQLNLENCQPDEEMLHDLGSACLPGQGPCDHELICKNFIKGGNIDDGSFLSYILPGGYCTTGDQGKCEANEGIFSPKFNICLKYCNAPTDCREDAGYGCLSFSKEGNTYTVCIPNTVTF